MKGEEFMEPLDLKRGKTLGGALITYLVYSFIGLFILFLILLIEAVISLGFVGVTSTDFMVAFAPTYHNLSLVQDITHKVFALIYTSILVYLATTELKNRMMKIIFFVINAICAISLPFFVAMLMPAIATFCNPKKIIKYQTSKSSLGPKETV